MRESSATYKEPFAKATPFGRCKPLAIVLTSRLPSLVTTAYTFPVKRVPTYTTPLGDSVIERPFGIPEAHSSTLKPGGTFNLLTGISSAGNAVIPGGFGDKEGFMPSGVRPWAQVGGIAGVAPAAGAGVWALARLIKLRPASSIKE